MLLQASLMKHRDDRLRLFLDVLSSIKTVKYCAWEPAFEKLIEKIRTKELRKFLYNYLLISTIDIFTIISSSLVSAQLINFLAVPYSKVYFKFLGLFNHFWRLRRGLWTNFNSKSCICGGRRVSFNVHRLQ